jgi:hypothetical protein
MAAQRAGFASPEPVGFGSAILEVVDAEKAPLRVFFGEQPLHIASYTYQQRLDQWTAWAPVSRDAEGREDGAPGRDLVLATRFIAWTAPWWRCSKGRDPDLRRCRPRGRGGRARGRTTPRDRRTRR